jgi:hemerythrin
LGHFEWTPEYSVSVESFDSEHKKLFTLINHLHESIQAGTERSAVIHVLRELSEFTRNHFAAEEAAMRRASYAGLEEHIAEHRVATAKVALYFAEYEAKSRRVAHDVLQFLRDWLQQHILVTDRKYSAALNSAGIR